MQVFPPLFLKCLHYLLFISTIIILPVVIRFIFFTILFFWLSRLPSLLLQESIDPLYYKAFTIPFLRMSAHLMSYCMFWNPYRTVLSFFLQPHKLFVNHLNYPNSYFLKIFVMKLFRQA